MSEANSPIWRPGRPGDPAAALEVLHRYEPILAFTEGEMFFPAAIDDYLRHCTLHERLADGATAVLAQQGELTPERLADLGAERPRQSTYLSLAHTPMHGAALQHWQAHRPVLEERATVSRGGLIERAGDVLARLPALLTARPSPARVAGVQTLYAEMLAQSPRFAYYGRVVEERAYTVLAYHYFYVMSDWCSSFRGAGDHVGSWTSVFVYLAHAGDGYLEPAWVACEGYDGVRVTAWDSPGLELADTHPKLFIAAGSHTAYFEAGDFTANVEAQALRPALQGLRKRLPFRNDKARGASKMRAPAVPFVEFARGDGASIGHGQSCEWTAVYLDAAQSWAEDYGGAWGTGAEGVFAAAGSSTGPKFDRDGAVRRSWSDPVGWANLDRQPPPAMIDVELTRRIGVLEHDAELVAIEADRLRGVLPQLELEIEALLASPGREGLLARRRSELVRVEEEIAIYDRRRSDDLASVAACREMRERHAAGSDREVSVHRTGDAVSTPGNAAAAGGVPATFVLASLLMVGVLLLVGGAGWYALLVVLIAGVFVVDSLMRGSFASFAANLAVGLAAATAVILAYELFWPLMIVVVATGGIVLLAGDLRETRVRL